MRDFLDDTSLSILDMKLVKAFLDVGLFYESMAWARWGASKWEQNQPRAVANNIYEDGLDLPHDFLDHITFENFYKLGFCVEGPHGCCLQHQGSHLLPSGWHQ